MNKMPETAAKFFCQICDFSCCKNSNFNSHLLTPKHKNRTKLNKLEPKIIIPQFICNICNKIYSPKYMTQHKKTLFHLENAYDYYVENQIEEKFENYFI